MKPISVILPVHEPDPGYLRETLKSLLAQTHEEFEVLIIEARGERSAAPLLEELSVIRASA
jgi:cellulose synthase/poly-beta-1,6-N-acetylglucosamine synthase-like glycosyltransferase